MTTLLRTPDAIKSEVQNHYGQIADANLQLAVASSCCGPTSAGNCCGPDNSSSCGSPLYLGEDLTDLPEAAVPYFEGLRQPPGYRSAETRRNCTRSRLRRRTGCAAGSPPGGAVRFCLRRGHD